MSTITHERRPRFKRKPTGTTRITGRDIEILRNLSRHRFLTTDLIFRLAGGTVTHERVREPASGLERARVHYQPQRLARRITQLFHAGYIDRPPQQMAASGVSGSAPMVYALGNKGAGVLREVDGRLRESIDWTAKNRTAGKFFVQHTLETAEMLVAVEVACRENPDIRFISPEEVLSRVPATARNKYQPFIWKAKIPGRADPLSVVPDAAFGIEYLKAGKTAWFVVEIDRGTMPVVRKSLKSTSLRRKFLAYNQTRIDLKAGKTNPFGWSAFRVLTLTTSAERIETMIACVKDVTAVGGTQGRGLNFFVFGVHQNFARDGALDAQLVTSTGKTITLRD